MTHSAFVGPLASEPPPVLGECPECQGNHDLDHCATFLAAQSKHYPLQCYSRWGCDYCTSGGAVEP